jgi:hypothetical protein
MPVQMKREDLEWLQEVRRLGLDGLTQQEIADKLGLTKFTLRSRLATLGFQMVGLTDVRTTLGGISLEALLERGDIVAAGEEAPATEAVPA